VIASLRPRPEDTCRLSPTQETLSPYHRIPAIDQCNIASTACNHQLNWRRHHTPLNLPTIPAALTASVLLFMRLRLKAFASEGGRILFVGEHSRFYQQAGLDVENQFLRDMGALMRNIGQSTLSGNTLLQVSQDNNHQTMVNVSQVQINTVSLIELGPNDYPLLTSADGSRVVVGVARININQAKVVTKGRKKRKQ